MNVSEHPLGDGLEFNEGLTAEDLRKKAREKTITGLLESADPRLAQVTFTFVDDQGVKREWSASHEKFDRAAYEDAGDDSPETEHPEGGR